MLRRPPAPFCAAHRPRKLTILSVSLFLLWLFGRTEGASADGILGTVVVLSFPGAIGAAAARLVL